MKELDAKIQKKIDSIKKQVMETVLIQCSKTYDSISEKMAAEISKSEAVTRKYGTSQLS